MIYFLQLRNDNSIIGVCSENTLKGNENNFTIPVELKDSIAENLFDINTCVPLYKYANEKVVLRTSLEVESEKNSNKREIIPSQLDRIEAQTYYTAMITDTLLEV